MTVTDSEVIEGISLDESIPCAIKDCTNEVEWKHIRKCCGFFDFSCDKHLKVYLKQIADFLAKANNMGFCGECMANVRGRVPEDILTIIKV
jgi:hypothetical protein